MTDFARTKSLFHLPEGIVYLDGNSLGPLPLAARDRVARLLDEEWGEMLIRGWNEAGWMDAPARIGERIGRLIGAAPGTVVMGDTLSIKLYQALAAALDLRPGRRVVLSDHGNFPSDIHMAKGLMRSIGRGHELRLVAPEAVADALDENVAALMLTEVDYRTGRLHDMAGLTQAAHAAGALTVWDLAHSAGALPIDLESAGADFAVGCTYKFLNGGPGAPAFIYVASRHIERVQPALSGWLGHEAPFAFDLDYRPGPGIARMRVGTPTILGLAALDAALDAWDGVSIEDVRARSVELSEMFIGEVERRCPAFELVSPRCANERGSQVTLRFADGYPFMQALIERGVIGDFRPPDMMRFGIAPLYLDSGDIVRAAGVMEDVLGERSWDRPQYRQVKAVT
ncbi:MAG: kynureninase [Rhodospirillales bacterium]|nr:kynureninase [Rhodospirillales bacterium]MDE0379993.1 kynureninase [Rhodospirillales bacterium]